MNRNSPLYVIGFMASVSILCGLAVSSIQYSMKGTLEANEGMARNRAIARAFGIPPPNSAEGVESALEDALRDSTFRAAGREWKLFMRKATPKEVGFIFSGNGFWDIITGIIVLSWDLSTVQALEIIDQKETPGLGARIDEPAFKRQFRGYPVDWNAPEERRIVFGDPSAGDGTPRIDAVTGATQTSLALEKILNEELEAFRKIYDNTTAAGE